MTTIYSGIDVSKDKLDAALTSDGSKILSTATFQNSILGFQKLNDWVLKHSKGFTNVHFCIEATGIYHEELSELLQENESFIVSVINPFQAKAFAGSRLQRTKNDKVDANLLACFCAISRPRETVRTKEEIKTLRKLVRTLNYQIEERAKYKMKLHVDIFPELKKQIELLESIPGIGSRTSFQILAELHSEDGKNINASAQVAHAGLAPREYQSGSSVKGKPRICKTGNKRLRKALYMPAMTAMRYNKHLSEFYQRLLSNGKPKMVALIAVMRKLLVLSVGVLNNGVSFDQNWLENRKEIKNQEQKFHKNFALAS